jgi:hypothetical protein
MLKHYSIFVNSCRGGATQWYFPGVAFNGDDVIIEKYDITCGSVVLHFVDPLIFSPAQRSFWTQQSKKFCTVGSPAPAQGSQQQQQPGVNAGTIAGDRQCRGFVVDVFCRLLGG